VGDFPDVELPERALERVDPARLKPFELMVLAVAERGAPMSYDAIRERLAKLGRVLPIQTLQKAWHGMPPLRKTASGELELVPELDEYAWKSVIWRVQEELGEGQRGERAQRAQAAPPQVDRRSPVTMDELRVAARVGLPFAVSAGRQLGMVLEAAGRPLATAELEALMKELAFSFSEASLRSCGHNPESAVRMTADGRWTVNSGAALLQEARRVVREIVRREQEREKREADHAGWREADDKRRRAEALAAEVHWATTPKRFVRSLYRGGKFVAAAFLDPDARSFSFAVTAEEARSAFDGVGIVLGIDPRAELERLGLPAGGREFVDLSPPAKSRRPERSTRVLKITQDRVLRSTLGKAGKLSDPKKLAAHVRAGHLGDALRRLEADLKVLYALHDYAQGHGFVRLRWRSIDEVLDLPGKANGRTRPLEALLKHARYREQVLDVVLYAPLSWEDPWRSLDLPPDRHRLFAQVGSLGTGHSRHVHEVERLRVGTEVRELGVRGALDTLPDA